MHPNHRRALRVLLCVELLLGKTPERVWGIAVSHGFPPEVVSEEMGIE